jgi:hypothetical protein
MVKRLLLQMCFIILPQNLDLAPQIIIRTLNQLKLTSIFMPLQVLSLNFCAALIIAVNNLEQTAFIMDLHVFEHYCLAAPLVLAGHTSERADDPVLFDIFPF